MHFLLSRGYPNDALLHHQPIDAHLRPDVTVIDTRTNKPLALIRIEDSFPEKGMLQETESHYSTFLNRHKERLAVYLFTRPENESHEPTIFILNESRNWEPIATEQFPNYAALLSQERLGIKEDRNQTIHNFKIVAYFMAIFFLSLFSASLWSGHDLTNSQLYLLGAALLLMVLPHYVKIKIAGLELERAADNPVKD